MATTVYGNQVTIASGVKTRLKYVYNTSSTGDSYTVSGTLYYGDSSVDGGSEYVSRNFSSAGYFEDGVRVWTQGTYVASDTVSFTFSKSQSAQSHTGRMSAFWRYGNSNDTVNSAIDVTVSVPAITTYTVSYNANGGTGAPSSQTKTYGVTLKLSSTKPTYSGYTFMGWATSSSNASAGTVAYAAGANYTANSNATLYAVWKRTVTYNANGGSGAPSAQTGYKGASTTLSSTIPTQTGFTFLGWNTSSNGSGTHYSPGVAYSDISTTLYAMWRRITLSVVSGTARRNGTTCSFSAKWVCQSTVGGTVSSSALYSDTDSMPSKNLTLTGNTTGTKVAGTNLTGTVSGSFTCPENTVGRALVTVTFTDTYSTAYSGTHVATAQLSVTVPKAFRLLTAKHGETWTDADGASYQEGIAIGMLASLIGRLEIGLTSIFRKAVTAFANVSVASESIDRDGTPPSTNTYGKQFRLVDKDGDAVGYMDGYQLTTGETGVRFVAFAGPSGDSVYNVFRIGKLEDGTNVYYMTDPAAFRIASNTAAVSDQSAQSVNISPGSGSTDFAIYANVTNSSSSDYGDRVALWARTDGIALYNSTDSRYDWNLTLPVGVDSGGTGVSTLGAGLVYHASNGTGAMSIASASNIVSELGNTAVNRATSDASGNNIASTYATQSSVNTIAIRNHSYINVLDYGAKGDGTTDDTQAFQDAFDAAGVGDHILIPFGAGQQYKITSNVSLQKNYVTVEGELSANISWQSHGIRFVPSSDTSVCFRTYGSGTVFRNLVMSTDNDSHANMGIAIYARRNSNADTDLEVIDCKFVSFNHAVYCYNRGCLVKNSSAALCKNGVSIAADDSITSSNTQRAIRIEGNRFHVCQCGVKVASSALPHGMVVSGNLMDLPWGSSTDTESNCLIYASCSFEGLTISDNTIIDPRLHGMYIGASGASIKHVNITGNNVYARTMNSSFLIRIVGSLEFFNISGNSFTGANASVFYIDAINCGCIGSNLILGRVDSSAASSVIYVSTSIQNVAISGNVMNLWVSSSAYGLRYSGTSTIERLVMQGNSCNGPMFNNVNGATQSHCSIQSDL